MNRLIAWFAENSVAANLLLLIIVAGGLVTLPQVKREVFPEISADLVTVTVEYPGAAPAEVEEAICVRIEEHIQGVDGIERVRSVANEGVGVVTVELLAGADARAVLDDVKARVDAIDTFPLEAEKPIIQEVLIRQKVISVAVAGAADEATLKHLAQRLRDDLTALPGITHAELAVARPYEIAIEVSEAALRRHGLTFDDVAQAVRRGSLDLPGGSIKTDGGEVLLRTKGQAYRGADFERLALVSRADGSRLPLGAVATVVDGFEETDLSAHFDGHPAVLVKVFRVGQQNALDLSDAVHRYVREQQLRLPDGVQLITWDDDAEILRSRLDTLLRNGRDGFLLVLLVLALFLRPRVAFWVVAGVPVCYLGTLWVMPAFDVSINAISLFAFILVTGILVDDAIVVGENICTTETRIPDRLGAAIAGAQQVATPVTFGVLTTVAAFAPMLAVPGPMGKFMRVIPVCVIAALLFSLIESHFVLPAHLAQGHGGDDAPRHRLGRAWRHLQDRIGTGLAWVVARAYRPSVAWALRWRYFTIATAVALLCLTIGLAGGGWIRFTFFPHIEADNAVAYVTMPEGTPARLTAEAVASVEAAAHRMLDALAADGQPVVRHIMTSVGEQPFREQQGGGTLNAKASGAHLGEVNIELLPSEQRAVTSAEVLERWRAATAPIPGAVELAFSSTLLRSGAPIDIQLQGPNIDDLRAAAARLRTALGAFEGVVDITDTFRGGKQELVLGIRPSAEALGLSMADLGRQVRQAFYGEEAQRIQRGRDDVKVMVRYPAAERRSLGDIEAMRIRTPDGDAVPFGAVATAALDRGFSAIRRADRQRVVSVTADVDVERTNANEVLATLRAEVLPLLIADYPGMSYSLEGEQREQSQTLGALGRGFLLALLAIFALLAIPLRSYVQPLIIMSAIPFGIVGAIWGHVLTGWDLSMFSVIGIIALAGVVVNDSLVLVSYVNEARTAGIPLRAAVEEAGAARFRAILLTSLTTFAGLTPLMLERSVQAQFLIPMAVSLAFGVLFATAVSLIFVPAMYLVIEDLRRLPARLRRAPLAVREHSLS